MPKRIIYLSPVGSMSGNLSGAQDLKYAKNNNPAWNAPEGQQYAKNYKPRFIASVRSRDGLQTFSLKTKSSSLITDQTRRRMAAMAFSQAFLDASQHNNAWPLTQLAQVYNIFNAEKGRNPSLTWRKYFSKPIYDMLLARRGSVTFYSRDAGIPSVTVNNPFLQNAAAPKFGIVNTDNMVKFWTQLAPGGMYFYIDALQGIAYASNTFGEIIADSSLNVLGLSVQTATQYQGFIMLGGAYVCYDVADPSTGEITKMSPMEGEYIDADYDYYLDAVPGESGG